MIRIAIVVLVACGSSGSKPPPPSQQPTSQPQPQPQPTTSCAADGDCNFADSCDRCVGAPARAACGTPSGSCVCFEGRCALRPSSPRISTQSCQDRCGYDLATAQCEPGLAGDDAPRFYGPLCACDPRDHRCHLHWFDPIPCETADDCWLDETPVLHAIRRPARLRGRPFRGCVDGEQVPACVDRRCTLRGLGC